MEDIFSAFKRSHENLHEYHEVLNDIITYMSIGVLVRHRWVVNISFDIKHQSHKYRHVTEKLLKSLPLIELFVFKNRVIVMGKRINKIFRDKVED